MLSALPRLDNPKIYKIDIKDFFNNGSHSELAETSTGIVHESVRSAFNLMVHLLLREQFIAASHDVVSGSQGVETFNKLFRVVRGSGIGLAMSKDISDACFFAGVEKLTVCRDVIKRAFNIVFYARFADDILIIFNNSTADERLRFMQLFKRTSKVYPLVTETVSSLSAPMLDMLVYFEDGRILTKPYRKPSCQKNWLADSSFHLPAIHVHWPLGYVSRLARVSSKRAEARLAIDLFWRELEEQCPGHVALGRRASKSQFSLAAQTDRSFIVLPFNQHWYSAGLNKFLRNLKDQWAPSTNVQVCWRLSSPHWFAALKKVSMS